MRELRRNAGTVLALAVGVLAAASCEGASTDASGGATSGSATTSATTSAATTTAATTSAATTTAQSTSGAGANLPVGAPCDAATDCSGADPTCLPDIATLTAADGYCSSGSCDVEECPGDAFCSSSLGNTCIGVCSGADECQFTNPDNRCFFAGSAADGFCLPSSGSDCDPTADPATCANAGLCIRRGYDDIGACYDPCAFGAACPDGPQGEQRACYFLNASVFANGMPSGDVAAGLVCLNEFGTQSEGESCFYLNECVEGLECNSFGAVGQGNTCARLCRNGQPADCPTGTCQDAFLLGAAFVADAVGLCI